MKTSALAVFLLTLCVSAHAQQARVELGVDVYRTQPVDVVAGQAPTETRVRVGALVNAASMDSDGRRTVDVLKNNPRLDLVAIFSPEHGLSAIAEGEIADSRDSETGVPIYSAYGHSPDARRPNPAVLKKLDVLVIDLPDVGVRQFTYKSTLGIFLEEAGRAGVRVVVFDRPNPLNGVDVQGPVWDGSGAAYVNYHALPQRHGMTIGELAMFFNAQRKFNVRLEVVRLRGWQRAMWFDQTGMVWARPSPNLPSADLVLPYAALVILEFTNVSVGRGTDAPFTALGAPWISGEKLAQYLNSRDIPGMRFQPAEFRPTTGPYAEQPCSGVRLVVTDRRIVDPALVGVEVASALLKLWPKQYDAKRLGELVGDADITRAILTGEDPRAVQAQWQARLDEFVRLRERYLQY
jgi:uncharacterized protein YbbC (DUF1343 family)